MNNKQEILKMVNKYGIERVAEVMATQKDNCPDLNGFDEALTSAICVGTDNCEKCWKALIQDALKEVK